MATRFRQVLADLHRANHHLLLTGVQRGVERESLRVQPDGNIALSPHPPAYGSALTNPHITTDFSEALLEFITPVCNTIDELLDWLTQIHQFAYAGLDNELLWAASMPCVLPQNAGIPVARYGSSNIAQMKTVYRLGLGHRYGRAMQTIAGVHYNFSFSDDFWRAYQQLNADRQELKDFKTEQYFHLIRNFRRYSWLLIYLFGASPALCKTFLDHDQHGLHRKGNGTLFAPFGTSLRMGDLGYQSNAQEQLFVSYNGLAEYSATLSKALSQPIADYEKIGTHRNGERIQLSTALLQIENEFYSSVRPKRVTRSGEAPLQALNDRGVEYIEVRCLDVNPYSPLGLDAEQIRFVDAFLLFCLLDSSPPIPPEECRKLSENNKTVVNQGRDDAARIYQGGELQPVQAAANTLLQQIADCAKLFDAAAGTGEFSAAWQRSAAQVRGQQPLPSAQVLADLENSDQSYFQFAMQQSRAHSQWFADHPMDPARQEYFHNCAKQSISRQAEIEAEDDQDFESFLADYYTRTQV